MPYLWNDQDVREDDGGVEGKTPQRLKGRKEDFYSRNRADKIINTTEPKPFTTPEAKSGLALS